MKNSTILMRSILPLVLLSMLFVAAPCVQAEGLTPEVVVGLKSVSSVAMSPGGDHVAYVLRIPRDAQEEYGHDHYEIWVASVLRGEGRRFVFGAGEAWSPRWSPDGSQLAFLSDRPSGKGADEEDVGETQVYVISLSGGEARRVTASKTSVADFKWSPDGREMAYVASDPKTSEEKEAEERGEDWTVVDENLKPRRLWAVGLDTGESREITTGEVSVWDFNWAPDGNRLVISTTDLPRVDDSYMFKELHVISAEGGEPTPLCETWGKLGPPQWSPGGDRVAFRAGVSSNDPFAGSVFVVTAPAGEAVNITPDMEASVARVCWLDENTLAFLAFEGTKSSLYTIEADGRGLKKISKEGPIFNNFDFSKDGAVAALTASTYEHPRELYLWKKGGLFSRGVGSMERVTFSNPALDTVDLAHQEVVRWTSTDGLEIEGLLLKPLGYEEGVRYPLVVQVHGGPEGVYLDGWTTSFYGWSQCLAAKGFAVLMPNYRGSIGRGVAFSRGDHRDLGGQEFQDVLSGVDYLVEQGLVDRDRVGIGGTSYGGYMSALAATAHSERFAAAVDHAGISNWISFTGTTDIPYEMCMVHWDFWLYDNLDLPLERSPITHVAKAGTPVLIVHGKDDNRVDPGQAWELYTALKEEDVETQLVLYPREGHGFSERAHRLDYMNRVISWFERHLKGGM